MLRKIVVVGDPINPAGIILSNGNSTATMGNEKHSMALVGGSVKCETCKSIGQIAKAGGPRRLNFMGEVALEGDIVLCRCPVHPKLIAQLHQTARYDDMSEILGILPPPQAGNLERRYLTDTAPRNELFNEYYCLVDDETGKPLANYDYAIVRENGRIEYGTTSDTGNTHLLSSTAESESIKIYA